MSKKSKSKKPKPVKFNGITLELCKREEYIDAWIQMYNMDKEKWSDPMFDGINPMLNKKPLATEINNICVIAYEKDKPVGIFSMVITKRNERTKVIGKQYIVDPDYQRRGIGKAMLLVLEREILRMGYDWYYIGCSSMSSSILKSLGREPYHSNEKNDLYKFNVDLDKKEINNLCSKYVTGLGFKVPRKKRGDRK